MRVTVANWVHRTIRSMEQFVDARDDAAIKAAYPGLDGVIGVYRNPPGVQPEEVVVTESALVLRDGAALVPVRFDEIASIQGPEKRTDGRIALGHQDGTRTEFVIGGRKGKFEDVYDFWRFLMRVTEELRDERRSRE